MTANDSKSNLFYLNKLLDEYIILIIVLLARKPIDADYSALNEEIETNPKASKFKAGYRVRITKYKIIFNKGYAENWSREIYVIDSVLKTNPWAHTIKGLKWRKNNRKLL